MGKMKDLFIDQMNNQSPDDTDWKYNQLDPLPEEFDINSGRGKWTIDGYEIWAHTYQQALDLLPLIKD